MNLEKVLLEILLWSQSMFDIEKDLVSQGKRYIIGIDEVGRGPLAGDVVAAAVCVDFSCFTEEETDCELIPGIKDSKKLSEKKRKELAKLIKERTVDFSIAGASAQVIDKINILQATILSMENALKNLVEKLKEKNIVPDKVLIDSVKIKTDLETMSINKGDDLCYSIACASILAKVYRDNLCEKWDEEYPGYGLKKHKGYATKAHREALVSMGPSPIHRITFLKNIEKWKDESVLIGSRGEDKAGIFLEDLGYKIIERNFKIYNGEIDLIAIKDKYIVFVEVKSRKDSDYGYGFEAVDKNKQKKIKIAAEIYYHSKGYTQFQPRFDVIEIYTGDNVINHYEDAFQ